MAERNYTALPEKEVVFELQDELDTLLVQAEALSCAFSQMNFSDLPDEASQTCMAVLNDQVEKARGVNKQLWEQYLLYLSTIK